MSDHKISAAKRRDERNAKIEPRRPSGSKRDTKHWCRGVVGREHEPVDTPHNCIEGWRVLRCKNCGKHLDYYCPSPFYRTPRPKPAWTTA